jgi:hypothetical protein
MNYKIENPYEIKEEDYTNCPYCKSMFIPCYKHRKYCSNECFKENRKLQQKRKQNERYLQQITCRHCGGKCTKNNYYRSSCCLSEECVNKEKRRQKQIADRRYYNRHYKKRNKKKDLERQRLYDKNNKQRLNIKNNDRKNQKRRLLINIKQQISCQACGEDRFYCLEFHHRNREEKSFGISEIISKKYGFEAMKKEIKKCVILCKNCHAELHFEEIHNKNYISTDEWLKNKGVDIENLKKQLSNVLDKNMEKV